MGKLDEIIKESELVKLTQESAELVLDSSLQEGILKDIPVVSTIMSLFRFANSISKKVFEKKLTKFLIEFANVPQDQRVRMIDQINVSNEYESSVGETLIELIEKIDSEKKPSIIGKLFKAFLQDNIKYEDFLKLSHIVNRCYIGDLIRLKLNVRNGKVYDGYSDELVALGVYYTDFLRLYQEAKEESSKQDVYAKLTEIGKLLIDYGF